MKQVFASTLFLLAGFCIQAQVMHSLPASGGNIKSALSQRIGVTDMTIHWDAPGVKGREGKIWGTQIAHYGFQNLGFGTAKESPWRAGANENTSLEFSTDVMIEGKPLAAAYYLQHNYNLDEALALAWADNAIGNHPSFSNRRLKADILRKQNRGVEADQVMTGAFDKAGVMELHQYGRQLLAEKNTVRAMEVFQMNYKKNGETWPTHVGLMRGYSATGDLKKALEHAILAQKQAPDEVNRKSLEAAVKTLSEGKTL